MLLLLAATFIVWTGYRDHEERIADEYRVLDITARHAEAQCAAALRAIDLLLQEVATDRQATRPTNAFSPSLQARLRQYPEMRVLAITDRDGRITVASNPQIVGFDASEREYFRAHRDAGTSALHISRPFTTVTGIKAITLSRPIRDQGGRLLGVALTTLASAYFEDVLSSVLPPGNSQALLVNRSGQVLWGVPNPEQFADKSLAETPAFRAHLAANTPLSHEIDSAKNGSIQALQSIGDSGLIVVIDQDIGEVLKSLQQAIRMHALLFLLAAAATLYLARVTWRSHQQLANAIHFSERIIETANVMVVGVDRVGRTHIFNAAAEDISGYRRDEVFDKAWFDLIIPQRDYLRVLDEFDRFRAAAGSVHSFESAIVTKDGHQREISWQGSRVADPGSTLATVFFGIDVTERKRAEEETRQAEAGLRRLIEESPLPMLVSQGEEQRIVLLNRQFKQVLGYTEEDLPDIARWHILAYPDTLYRPLVIAAWARSLAESSPNQATIAPTEARVTCKNGEERIFDAYITQIGDRRLVVFVDLTERRRVEARLAETLEFSERIIAESPSGVLVYRGDGPCVMANEAAAHILGGTREALLEQNYRRLASWRASGFIDAAQDTLSHGKPVRTEAHLTTTFGKEMWIECRMTRLTWGGKPHLLLVATDVSEFRLAEQALLQATQIAESANRTKSAFLANMSHEIRTPMNAIIGLSQLALDAAREPKLRDQLHKIFTASSALLNLLNDILDSSRIEAGRLKIEATNFSLAEVVGNALALMGTVAASKDIALVSDIAPDVPGHLNGDPLRLGQVLTNLLGNAVKFTEHGSIAIIVRLLEKSATAARLSFAVIDTGIGMNADQLDGIFQPFVQADDTITRRFGGSGLGLTISRGLLHLMGGDIDVTSEPGKGSRFSFELEFGVVDLPAPMRPAPPVPPPLKALAAPIAGARILLVEDNSVNQQVARSFLESAGLQVSLANHGSEALELLENENFDAVLMDLQMPVMSGVEATRRIRDCERWHQLPIIAVTASAMAQDREECLAVGMNEHIAKPIDAQRLIETLVRLIPRRNLGADGTIAPDDKQRVALAIRELDAQLQRHDFVGVDNLATLLSLHAVPPEIMARLEQAVARYDYDAARSVLADLAATLYISS